jgi:hypothetical protein
MLNNNKEIVPNWGACPFLVEVYLTWGILDTGQINIKLQKPDLH